MVRANTVDERVARITTLVKQLSNYIRNCRRLGRDITDDDNIKEMKAELQTLIYLKPIIKKEKNSSLS